MAILPWVQALKDWLAKNGKTAAWLHKEAGIPQSTISDWMSGRSSGTRTTFRKWRLKLLTTTGIDMDKGGDQNGLDLSAVPIVSKEEKPKENKVPEETNIHPATTGVQTIPNFFDGEQIAIDLGFTYAALHTFLRFSSKAQREAFRRSHPDLAFEVGNLTAALASEEGYQQMLAKGKI